MSPISKSARSAVPHKKNVTEFHTDQLNPPTHAYILRGTPDWLFDQVLKVLSPKYQIDDKYQLVLSDTIKDAFNIIKAGPGNRGPSRPPVVPSGVPSSDERYSAFRNMRKSASAINNHYTHNKYSDSDKTHGGFGAPKSATGAFYFHHTDPAFKKAFPHADRAQYEKSPKPQGSRAHRLASEEMSPSKARMDRIARSMIQKRAAETKIKQEPETDVDEDKTGDKTADAVNTPESLQASANITIKIEKDDSGIDMNDLRANETQDSTQQDAVFTQTGASTSGSQLSDTTKSPEPTGANKATETETKKPGPVRLKLNLPKIRRSSRIASRASSAVPGSERSSSSGTPASPAASSLGKRARRGDEEEEKKGKASKRAKLN